MDVVGRATHAEGGTFVLVEYPGHIRMHFRKMTLGERVRPPLCGEHKMEIVFGKRL